MLITNKLSSFIAQTSFEDFPDVVTRQAKRCILDFIGVALAGYNMPFCKLLIDFLKEQDGKSESTIIGDGCKVPALSATLANAVMGHALELDDGHNPSITHPASVVIPAALGVGELMKTTGRDLITSVILGYEAMIRIGNSIQPSHSSGRGFHATGTCGTFGAATAAGKMLGLNEDGMRNCLGIAGLQSAGLREIGISGQSIKPLLAGKAAQSGVLAALLAQRNIPGPEVILEGRKGFLRAVSDAYDLSKIVEGLGKRYEFMNVYFKFYAACRLLHPSIDAVLELVQKHRIEPEQIEEVKVITQAQALDIGGKVWEPKTVEAAKFSLPYVLATAIIERHAGPEAFTEDKIKNPKVLSIAKRVAVSSSPELDNLYPLKRVSIVLIRTKAGKTFKRRTDAVKGDPEMPASDEDLIDKFRNLSSRVLLQKQIEKVLLTINMLEKLDDVSELTRMCLRQIVT